MLAASYRQTSMLLALGLLASCATNRVCNLSDLGATQKYRYGSRPAFTLQEAVDGKARLKGKAVALKLVNGEVAEGLIKKWNADSVSLVSNGLVRHFPADDILKLRRAVGLSSSCGTDTGLTGV